MLLQWSVARSSNIIERLWNANYERAVGELDLVATAKNRPRWRAIPRHS